MTDVAPDTTASTAVSTAAAPSTYVAPPEPDGDVAAAVLLDDLMIDCGSTMPKAVLAAVRPTPGAGSQLPRIEGAVEAIYDWACNGTDCPDEARRTCAGCAYVMNRFGFHVLGSSVNGGPSRAALMVLELKRQLGDPQSTAAEVNRPVPQGAAVANPVEAVTTIKNADIAALLADLNEAKSDPSKLEAAIAGVQARLAPPAAADAQAAATTGG